VTVVVLVGMTNASDYSLSCGGSFMYGAAVLAMKGPVVLEPLTCQVCLGGEGVTHLAAAAAAAASASIHSEWNAPTEPHRYMDWTQRNMN
jgi:hypothetical protein